MNETLPLNEVSDPHVIMTDAMVIKRETTWISSKEEIKKLMMERLLVWDDKAYYGSIEFNVHEKLLYDRLYEYLKLNDPRSLTEYSPFEFKLSKTKYLTEWLSLEGMISCYHRWFSRKKFYNDDTTSDGWGRIEFKIDNRKIFEKITSYAGNFKP